MSTTKKVSRNLSARQRARLATEENQRKLKTRQKSLAKVFSALDARDDGCSTESDEFVMERIPARRRA